MTIAEQIHRGATPEDLGISAVQYEHRKELVDRFVEQWDGAEPFSPAYIRWIQGQPEGQPPPQGTAEDTPSTKDMAKSAAGAAARFVGSGFKTVDRDEHERRWAICQDCSHLSGGRCKLCGCFMKAKTWLPKERCRDGRW